MVFLYKEHLCLLWIVKQAKINEKEVRLDSDTLKWISLGD